MFKNLSGSTKQVISAVLPLVIVLFLSFVVGQFGLGKISGIRLQIARVQKEVAILNDKLNLLRSVSGEAQKEASVVTVALPESNPSLVVLTQLKVLAAKNSISLSGIKSGGEVSDSSGLQRVDISFDAEGSQNQMLSFMKDVKVIAPLTLIDRVKMNASGGVARAGISVKSFWSPLPKELPPLTTQITGLTSDERKLLTDVSGLALPPFSEVPVSENAGKSDPFSP